MINVSTRILITCACLAATLTFFQPQVALASDAAPRVKMVTNLGEMVIQLDREKAPQTVDNFLQYAKDGYYEGTIFHRVIKDFMIQGGGFTLGFEKKQTREAIQNEADNGLRNNRFTIAMARTQAPHSATAQFFINTADNDFLNHRSKNISGWGYTVFGEVVEGQDVAEWIGKTPTGPAGPFAKDVPTNPIVIESVSLLGSTDDAASSDDSSSNAGSDDSANNDDPEAEKEAEVKEEAASETEQPKSE